MIWSWFKQRRRRQLAAAPFPPEWQGYLHANMAYYGLLSPPEQDRLQRDTAVFVAEKNWEGCGGLTITDEIKVTIAAGACLLVLAREHDYFERVLSILVYPSGFAVPGQRRRENADLVGEDARSGEAWYRGPVILSWSDALEDSRDLGGGRNLVWHEFAHQLDMLDRLIDGTPPLDSPAEYSRWQTIMTAEYQQLKAAAQRRQRTLIDPYGSVNEAEFFAVVTECFFDRPVELAEEHPELYDLLRGFYRQDTAARLRHARQRG